MRGEAGKARAAADLHRQQRRDEAKRPRPVGEGAREAKRPRARKEWGAGALGFQGLAGARTLYTPSRSGYRALAGLPCPGRPTCLIRPRLKHAGPGRPTCRGVSPGMAGALCRAGLGPINFVQGLAHARPKNRPWAGPWASGRMENYTHPKEQEKVILLPSLVIGYI
jgi:hypothetical protein